MPPARPRLARTRRAHAVVLLALAACGAPRGEPGDAEPAAATATPEPAAPDSAELGAEGPPARPVFGAFAVWATTAEAPGEPRKDIVRRVVRGALMQVRLCYSVALRTRPGLQGRVAALFEIAPDGAVGEVQVASELETAPEVGDCVRDVIAKLKFPAMSSAAVVVNYPFALSP